MTPRVKDWPLEDIAAAITAAAENAGIISPAGKSFVSVTQYGDWYINGVTHTGQDARVFVLWRVNDTGDLDVSVCGSAATIT